MLKDLIAVLRGELSSALVENLSAIIDKRHQAINQMQKLNGLYHQREVELLHPMSLAMGRLVAKLDPTYNVDEMNPDRRKASDAIGESVMNRLRAEAKAQRHMTGEG